MALAHGHFGAIDVAAALAHQAWLVSGPSERDVRRWFCSVRYILTDAGPEHLTNSMPDAVGAFCKYVEEQRVPAAALLSVDMKKPMCPNAIPLLGWNHQWDNVAQWLCCRHLPFYPGWLRKARVVTSWLRIRSHRQASVTKATHTSNVM